MVSVGARGQSVGLGIGQNCFRFGVKADVPPGARNDVAQVRGTIGGLLRARQPGPARSGDGEMRLAAGMVLGWYAAKTPRALKKALKRYRAFRDFTPFWV